MAPLIGQRAQTMLACAAGLDLGGPTSVYGLAMENTVSFLGTGIE
jgi:hypothetical protein